MIKIAGGILAAVLLVQAVPMDSYQMEWLRSYETVAFNTVDGDLDIGQYAEFKDGYIARTEKDKDSSQPDFVRLKNWEEYLSSHNINIGELELVNVICEKCAYYNEFIAYDGSIVRERSTATTYNQLREEADASQPSKTGYRPIVVSDEAAAAIAYDNSAFVNFDGSSSVSYSYTVSGANPALMAGAGMIDGNTADMNITALTYNGASLTEIRRKVASSVASEIWYKCAPATGANTLAFTFAGTVFGGNAHAVSITGTDNTSSTSCLNASNDGQTDPPGDSVTTNVTSTVDNAWALDLAVRDSITTDMAAGAGQTETVETNCDGCRTGTSYEGPKTPAGSITMSWSQEAAESNKSWVIAAAAFAPGSSNSGPAAPTSLTTEGQTNPTEIVDTTPEFSAIYSDSEGDSGNYYKIQVSTSSSFTGTYWDSGQTGMATTTSGSRSPEISYGGSALATSTTYYWRIKFWDTPGLEGAWSTASATFALAADAGSIIQNLSFTYDANGNITQIIDNSNSDTSKVTTYAYDDLNRLTAASTTNASSGSNYAHVYNYNAIGNITSSTPAGTYVYGSSTYANPHAATQINGVTHTYDTNGNLTSDGTWTHAWDYRNRLAQSSATSTLTYTYDHVNTRVRFVTPSSTLIVPTQYYSTEGGTAVKHIYAGNQLVATVRGSGASSTLYAIHPDHLGSPEKITNISGGIVQVLDYYPYGGIRTDNQYGFDSTKKFIGQDYDEDTALGYFQNRYYSSGIGRFLSQDPSFLDIGSAQFEQKYQRTLQQHLAEPQSLNSYAYANNNPITFSDPTGEQAQAAIAAAPLILLAPEAALVAIGGGLVIGGIILYNELSGNRLHEVQDAGNPQFTYKGGPEEPPRGEGPSWKKIGFVASLVLKAIDVFREKVNDIVESIENEWRPSNSVDTNTGGSGNSASQQQQINAQIYQIQQQIKSIQGQINQMIDTNPVPATD